MEDAYRVVEDLRMLARGQGFSHQKATNAHALIALGQVARSFRRPAEAVQELLRSRIDDYASRGVEEGVHSGKRVLRSDILEMALFPGDEDKWMNEAARLAALAERRGVAAQTLRTHYKHSLVELALDLLSDPKQPQGSRAAEGPLRPEWVPYLRLYWPMANAADDAAQRLVLARFDLCHASWLRHNNRLAESNKHAARADGFILEASGHLDRIRALKEEHSEHLGFRFVLPEASAAARAQDLFGDLPPTNRLASIVASCPITQAVSEADLVPCGPDCEACRLVETLAELLSLLIEQRERAMVNDS